MAEQVVAALKAHKRRLSETGREALVFPGERGECLDGSALRRRYKKALKAAKLRQLRFHDLRHTFGSIAINQPPSCRSSPGWVTPTCRRQ